MPEDACDGDLADGRVWSARLIRTQHELANCEPPSPTVYFACAFLDEEMLVPFLEPFVFIGRNLSSGDVDSVYFQDVESWMDGLRFGTEAAAKGARFRTGSVDGIYTYERAVDLLLGCLLRRNEFDSK